MSPRQENADADAAIGRRKTSIVSWAGTPKRALLSSLAQALGLNALTEALGRLSIVVATLSVVSFAVLSASFVSYLVWWIATDVMPPRVIPISATIAFLVATPIAGYLVSVIHSLAKSRTEMAQLAQHLVTARDQAREANEAKSRFLASTSHELRTPLNAILGFSEVVKDEMLGPCGQKRYVEYAKDIHASGMHLLNLINDVLDLSKIESGHDQIDTNAICDLQQIIEEMTKVANVLASRAGVALSIERAASEIHILANERMMRQIILNLLSNAIKFTPKGGRIIISARGDASSGVIVGISDTGIGMSGKDIEVAMKPFGQIDSKLSRLHKGTGLGLPLCKAMVALHGGELSIQSVPSHGTTVSFTIPAGRLLDAYVPLRAAS